KDSEGHGLIWLIRNVANFIAPWQNRILLNKQWQFINWSVNQDRILAAIFNAIPEINPFTFWQVDCTASLTFLNNWSCQNVFAHHVFIIHVIHMWIIFIIQNKWTHDWQPSFTFTIKFIVQVWYKTVT